MLKQIKNLGLVLVVAGSLVFTGCTNKTEELTIDLTGYETEIADINEGIVVGIEDMDKVILEEELKATEDLIAKLELELAEYKEDETEYKLYKELIKRMKYYQESIIICLEAIENPFEALLNGEMIKEQTQNYMNKINKSREAYNNYKKELGIETTPIESTTDLQEVETKEDDTNVESKENETTELKEDETGKKPEAKQESKVQQKTYYCEWCECNTDHTSDNHIGQCYDCGKEMKASLMTFNGRSFHCGCIDNIVDCQECGKTLNNPNDICEYDGMILCQDCNDIAIEMDEQGDMWMCEGCSGSFIPEEMRENPDTGISYCDNCYNEIYGAGY